MNSKMIFNTVGKIILLEGILLFLPLAVSIYYSEQTPLAFLSAIAIALVVGGVAVLLSKPKSKVIFAKEGFMITAISWIAVSLIGALPFFISGEIPSFVDAFFETVSGFTTTGSSILVDVEAMSKGLLFWRSFTHWIGGMGVIVLMMALLPSDSGRSMHIMRAEVPGPVVGKLVPKIKDTARILYLIYLGMTVLQVILLLCGGMSLFDSLLHTFGTAGTGGFGIKADGLASYSPYLQTVITVFMLLFGINFNLYYLILLRRFKAVFKSTELWVYLGIFSVATLLITIDILPQSESISEGLLQSSFQVSSIMTTTGYATTNFDLWPTFSKSILLLLMFMGACAGSTAGGFKISRVVILFKSIKADLRQKLHPRSVTSAKFEGKTIEKATMTGVRSYFVLYIFLFAIIFLLVSLEPFSIETNFSAAASCFNNIGPGLDAVGPSLSYFAYTDFTKIVLSIAMLLGRLEIYPLLFLFMPATWSKKS